MAWIFSLPGLAWGFIRRLTWRELVAIAVTAGAALIYIKGRRDGVAAEKTDRLEQETRDREKLDRLKPSTERTTVDSLRRSGF